MKKLFLLLSVLGLLGSPLSGQAATFEPIATLTPLIPGSPTLQDDYGQVIYFHDDYLFVGAPLARPDPTKVSEGAVYVYKKAGDQWINTQILITNGMLDHFSALTIKALDDWLFISGIGTPIGPIPNDTAANQNFTGSIQIYRRDKHSDQYVFYQAIDRFTPGLENLTVADPGALTQPIVGPIPLIEQGAAFGLSFDLDPKNELLLVGAGAQLNIDSSGNPLINSGVVFAFKHKHNQWKLIQTLYNPDGVAANDTFGGVVKINKKFALISNSDIFTEAHLNTNSSVYLYRFHEGQWHFLQKIRGDQTSTLPLFVPILGGNVLIGDNFGASIAFDGKWALIGSPFENLGTPTVKGAAYLFKLENSHCGCGAKLVFQQKIISDDPNALLTGVNVALQGKTALVADPTHTGPQGQIAQGAILVYHLNKRWTKEATLFDPNGGAFELFSNGLAVNHNLIFGGTGTALSFLFLNRFPVPPLLDIPLPLQQNKVVIWKRHSR